MRRKLVRHWAVGLAAMLASMVFAGCEGGGNLGLVTRDDEVEFGAEAHQELLVEYQQCTACGQVEVAPGVTVTSYIEALGQQMAVLGNPDRGGSNQQIQKWTFTVLESEEINAFALPGGFVYVTTGLLEIVHNKAELAGIVGHEVAHVTNYHGVERIESFMLAQGLSLLLFGDDEEMAAAAAGFVLQVDSFVNSKDAEREADKYGFRYAYEGGYNALEMNRFFEDISALYDQQDPLTSGLSAILGSHPEPQERIQNVHDHAADLGVTADDPNLLIDDSAVPFSAIKSALAGRSSGPQDQVAGSWLNLSERTRRVLHACTYDPRTRRIIELNH